MGTPERTVDSHGTIYWRLDGRLHRTDGPAIETRCGHRYWFLHGLRHRDGAPAREWADGGVAWYQHGELHRTDGPAIETQLGDRQWWLKGTEVTEADITVLAAEPGTVRTLAVELHAGGVPVVDAIAAARRLT